MQVDSGTFAKNGAGSITLLMNQLFNPSLIIFFVTGKTSGDTETHIAIGYYHGGIDGTLQASNGKSSETRSKTLSHYAATTEKIGFTVTATRVEEIDITFTASDVNYNIHYIAIA